MNSYSLTHELGRDMHNNVLYKGRKRGTIEIVAVKSIDKEQTNRADVLIESSILKQFRSPYILRLYEHFETHSHFWYVTELCHGGDLAEILKKDNRLPDSSLLLFAEDLFQGLFYIHSRGVVCGALRPSTILIDGAGRLKYSEFSQACSMRDPHKLTSFRFAAPCYIAPELFLGGVASSKSDLWALGCILYEMKAGRPPFFSTTFSELAQLIIGVDPPPLEGCDPNLINLITQLLCKTPETRLGWKDVLTHPFFSGKVQFDNISDAIPGEPKYHAVVKMFKIKPPTKDVINDNLLYLSAVALNNLRQKRAKNSTDYGKPKDRDSVILLNNFEDVFDFEDKQTLDDTIDSKLSSTLETTLNGTFEEEAIEEHIEIDTLDASFSENETEEEIPFLVNNDDEFPSQEEIFPFVKDIPEVASHDPVSEAAKKRAFSAPPTRTFEERRNRLVEQTHKQIHKQEPHHFGELRPSTAANSGNTKPSSNEHQIFSLLRNLLFHPTDTSVSPIIMRPPPHDLPFDTSLKMPFTIVPFAEVLTYPRKRLESFFTPIYRCIVSPSCTPEFQVNTLTYFSSLCCDSSLADMLIKSSFIKLFRQQLTATKETTIQILIVLIFGLLIRYATRIGREFFQEKVPQALFDTCSVSSLPVRQMAFASLGEYLFYLTTQVGDESGRNTVIFDSEELFRTSAGLLVHNLEPTTDEKLMLYSLRTIDNISARESHFSRLFATSEIASKLFSIVQTPKAASAHLAAASALAHIARLKPLLLQTLFKHHGPALFLSILQGEARLQQSALNILNLLLLHIQPSDPPAASPSVDYSNLLISQDIKDLFEMIGQYKPPDVPLDTKLKPFVPDYVPAVGDIDAFIKVPRPDGESDDLGMNILDEPAAKQSEPAVLELKLRDLSKTSGLPPIIVQRLENADKNPKAIKTWIDRIEELHRTKPAPDVVYSRNMPALDSLMEEWPAEIEELFEKIKLPSADLDVELIDYARLICGILDLPVYSNIMESLHLLFSLYSAFKENEHFRAENHQSEHQEPNPNETPVVEAINQ